MHPTNRTREVPPVAERGAPDAQSAPPICLHLAQAEGATEESAIRFVGFSEEDARRFASAFLQLPASHVVVREAGVYDPRVETDLPTVFSPDHDPRQYGQKGSIRKDEG